MTRNAQDIIDDMRNIVKPRIAKMLLEANFEGCGKEDKAEFETEFEMILILAEKALDQELCEDCVSREHLLSEIDELMQSPWFNHGKDDDMITHYGYVERKEAVEVVRDLCVKTEPSVTPKQRLCKNCKFFEYDSVEEVDGVPLIVAHEICNKWGDGCRTSEDGYCFLFKPKMEGEDE